MGRKATNLAGMRFGKLVVLEREFDGIAKPGRPFWKCICDCGNTTIVSSNHLKNNSITSCGCGQRRNDLTGRTFGRWTVLERKGRVKSQQMWLCKCDCGTIREVTHTSLVCGKSLSCGCYHKDIISKMLTTHGMSDSRIYSIYYNIKRRCNNPNDKRYKDYGGRGIKICKEWDDSFLLFLDWSLSNGYTEYRTIDRIDNNKGYCPENCRWTTEENQRNNKRNTVYIEVLGKKMSLRQWCDLMGWKYSKYIARSERGKTIFLEDDINAISSKLKE